MQFDMTKATTMDSGPLPEGEYDVTIEKAEERDEFIELHMRLANRRMCWDRLYADNPTKARFAAEAAGLTFSGELKASDLEGLMVRVELKRTPSHATESRRITLQPRHPKRSRRTTTTSQPRRFHSDLILCMMSAGVIGTDRRDAIRTHR